MLSSVIYRDEFLPHWLSDDRVVRRLSRIRPNNIPKIITSRIAATCNYKSDRLFLALD